MLWCSPRGTFTWFTHLTSKYLSKLQLVISEARSEYSTFGCLQILFREFEIDQWKVLALDMGNGNLIACLSTHKHREILFPYLLIRLCLLLLSVKTSFHGTSSFSSWVELHPFGSDFLLLFIATQIGHSFL
jgi:hypothetical protein